MKKNLTAAFLLVGLLMAAPSCSNEEGDGDGGSGDGDSSGDGDGDLSGDGDGTNTKDADGDGILDSLGTTVDKNQDGNPDQIDIDGDGIADGIGVDTNGDGIADGIGIDTDADGVLDTLEPIDPANVIAVDFEACASEAREAETLPADILFMIDQSVSMVQNTVPNNTEGAPTRWKVLRDAVVAFVEDDESAGLRVGLDFFPQAGDALDPQGNNSFVSCTTEDYMTPEADISALPGAAGDFLEAYPESPDGGLTPSFPALEGSLSYARQWASMNENAGRGIAVVWVSDGYPTVCEERTISGIAAMVKTYAEPVGDEARVPTFVVGLGEVPNLTTIARAGGTGDAFFVADDDDAVDGLIAALRRVANSPALCEFNFPKAADGSPLDKDKVNMQFTPKGGTPEVVKQTDGPESCGSTGGWYYDDPEDPQNILVCPATCGNFGGGVVSIVVGCESVTVF